LAEQELAAWTALLDDLDRELGASGRALAARGEHLRDISDIRRSHEPLGVMPAEIVDRARGVLAAYDVAMTRVQDARREVGDHLLMLESAGSSHASKPVYLDRIG
jgi:hypothetical protein